jgi:hypothetical protein
LGAAPSPRESELKKKHRFCRHIDIGRHIDIDRHIDIEDFT